MNTCLITFADGSEDLRAAGNRICSQALESTWFDDVVCHDLKSLEKIDSVWCKTYDQFFKRYTRGLGNWLWKPKVIFEQLRLLNRGDILVYADAGYEINGGGSTRFEFYKDMATANDFLAFELTQNIGTYTKGDALSRFGIGVESALCGYPQHQAGLLVIRKTEFSLELFNYWLRICCEDSGRYISDAPSLVENPRGFIDHRHDQSIFSLLMLSFGGECSIPIEDYWPELWNRGLYPRRIPFHAMRNKTGVKRIVSTASNRCQ